jgi:aminobenzoyl-glutamate utilization protein B
VKKIITRLINKEKASATTLAKQIWELAEPGFCEYKSARLLAEYLDRAGFHVDFCFKNIPTAFKAISGRGKPIIGILGEYDALPDLIPINLQKIHTDMDVDIILLEQAELLQLLCYQAC